MIAYEDLVTALQSWRARQGFSTGPSDFLGDPPHLTIGGLPVDDGQVAEQYTDLGGMDLVNADDLEVVEESTAVLDEDEIFEEHDVTDEPLEEYADPDAYAVGDQTDAAVVAGTLGSETDSGGFDAYPEQEAAPAPVEAADDVFATQPVPVVAGGDELAEAPPAYDEAPAAYDEAPATDAYGALDDAQPVEAYGEVEDDVQPMEAYGAIEDAPPPVDSDFDDAPTAFSGDPDGDENVALAPPPAPSDYDDEATAIAMEPAEDNAPPPVALADEQTMDVDFETDIIDEVDEVSADEIPVDADAVLTSAPVDAAAPPPLAPPPSLDDES